jgi:hypothetical protein
MTIITPETRAIDDCMKLIGDLKNGHYTFESTKKQLERKWQYKFVAENDRDNIRGFYDTFCCKKEEEV